MSFELILPFLRPIEPLLLDESISEIMGNPDASWWYERDGIIRPRTDHFLRRRQAPHRPRSHCQSARQETRRGQPQTPRPTAGREPHCGVNPSRRESCPGPAIRKFTSRHYTVDDLIIRGTLTPAFADFLAEQIRSGKTLLISGGTGTGKTTLFRILANSIPDKNASSLSKTPPSFTSGSRTLWRSNPRPHFNTNISFDDLLKDPLRLRPDRIILGEVRGIEARTSARFLQHWPRRIAGDHSCELSREGPHALRQSGHA